MLFLQFLNVAASNEDDCADEEVDFEISQLMSPEFWLRYLLNAYSENPYHMLLEMVFFILIIYLVFRRPEKKESLQLTEREEEAILRNWKPEPLVPEGGGAAPDLRKFNVNTPADATFTIGGKNTLNFISSNYLGLAGHPVLIQEAEQTIKKLAVGSCGPRGFYGTMDAHLNLENKLGEIFSEEGDSVKGVIYADWLGVPSSIITAFTKKGDLVLADENIHWLFKQGIAMSRCKVIYYQHNNLDHLETILQDIQQKDNQDSHFQLNRRFIVAESIYDNSGELLDLPKIMSLKNRYKYRLIVDDSNGLGTLDKRGVAGYYNIPVSDIDVYCSSMDKALGSIGGFVVGNEEITNRQTLYSFGYVFSASAPPFQVNCASKSFDLFSRDLTARLNEKVKIFRSLLTEKLKIFQCESHPDSPLIVLKVPDTKSEVDLLALKNWYLEQELYLFCSDELPKDKYDGDSYLRLSVTVLHTKKMLEQAADIIASGEKTWNQRQSSI